MKSLILFFPILWSISAFGAQIKMEFTSIWKSQNNSEVRATNTYDLPLGKSWTLPSQEGRKLDYRFKINFKGGTPENPLIKVAGEIFIQNGEVEKVVSHAVVVMGMDSKGEISAENELGETFTMFFRYLGIAKND